MNGLVLTQAKGNHGMAYSLRFVCNLKMKFKEKFLPFFYACLKAWIY